MFTRERACMCAAAVPSPCCSASKVAKGSFIVEQMLCASSDVILPVKRKARRRTIAAREEGREREIEFLLTCSQHVDSSLRLMEAPKRREMSRDQFDSMRDVGLSRSVPRGNSQVPTPTPDTHHATAQSMEIPLACFVLACKFVETYALRLIDVVGIVDNSVTAHTLHAAENTVLDVLGWDIHQQNACHLNMVVSCQQASSPVNMILCPVDTLIPCQQA